MTEYRLEYLPVARQDMVEVAQYISRELSNPLAAKKLAAAMVEAANKLRHFPYLNRAYQPIRPLEQEYRKLMVENYIMFYYIEESLKLVVIARVIYAGRDIDQLLK